MSSNCHLLVNFAYFSLSPVLKVNDDVLIIKVSLLLEGDILINYMVTIYLKGNSIREVKLHEGTEVRTKNG